MLHVPPEQRPEQHSPLEAHAFPAVVQLVVPAPPSPPPIGAHFPPTQVSVQQALPDAGQESPSETHWAALHEPPTHAPVQQSVPTVQDAPGPAHAPIEATQPPP